MKIKKKLQKKAKSSRSWPDALVRIHALGFPPLISTFAVTCRFPPLVRLRVSQCRNDDSAPQVRKSLSQRPTGEKVRSSAPHTVRSQRPQVRKSAPQRPTGEKGPLPQRPTGEKVRSSAPHSAPQVRKSAPQRPQVRKSAPQRPTGRSPLLSAPQVRKSAPQRPTGEKVRSFSVRNRSSAPQRPQVRKSAPQRPTQKALSAPQGPFSVTSEPELKAMEHHYYFESE
nr:uncharacterized protein LOC113801254 [Penaeus vannamei]